MDYVAALLAIICFAVALELVRVLPVAAKTVAVCRDAAASIRDPSLTDYEKETLMRGASITLMGAFFSILLRGLAAIGASLVPLLVFDVSGLARFSDVTGLLASWEAIVTVSIAMALVYIAKNKKKRH